MKFFNKIILSKNGPDISLNNKKDIYKKSIPESRAKSVCSVPEKTRGMATLVMQRSYHCLQALVSKVVPGAPNIETVCLVIILGLRSVFHLSATYS